MKKLFILFMASCCALPMLGSSSDKLIQTTEVYKLLEENSHSVESSQDQLKKLLQTVGYRFRSRGESAVIDNPDHSVSFSDLQQIMKLIYRLNILHNQYELTLTEGKIYYSLLESYMLQNTSSNNLFKIMQEFVVDHNIINSNYKTFHVIPIMPFYSIILKTYFNHVAESSTKTFNIPENQQDTIRNIFIDMINQQNLFGLIKYNQPIFTFNKNGWTFNELDILCSLNMIVETLKIVGTLRSATNKDIFIQCFKKYLNEYCWIYRYNTMTYIGNRMASKNNYAPYHTAAIKKMITQADFKWRDEEITVARYAANDKDKKVDTITETVEQLVNNHSYMKQVRFV